MRIAGLTLSLIVLYAVPAFAADTKSKQQTDAEKAQAVKMARIDAVAKQAFTAADHNHNDILSKTEFPDAEEYLEEGLMQLGNQGVLGQIQKGQATPNQAQVSKAVAAAPTNLSNKKVVSLSEFQLFARAMGAQADVMMAQNRAAYQAYMQQMQKNRGRGGRGGQRQVHTGTPIFLGP